jgi:acetoin utilization protein AcuC
VTRRAGFVYSDILSRHVLRENHVMVPTRLRYTYELLEAYGVFQQPDVQVVEPRQATEAELLTFHSQEYVEAVKSLSRGETRYPAGRFGFSQQGDNPIFPGMYEAYLWSTGASVKAAELVAGGQMDVAFNASGGLHPAMPDHASGFCVFNDPVIAINHLLGRGLRVASVDIDAHHGDGVQHAFYGTDRVLTISLHEAGTFLFPGTGFPNESGTGQGLGYAVNVPLYPYTNDELYLWAFREVVLPLVRRFQPDVLVTQLGIDTHVQDPITHLALTVQGFAQVVKELGELGYPWLALGGGGYDLSAVARGWALAFATMAGVELPDEIPQEYQKRYGTKRLRDPEPPPADSQIRAQARRYAEETVEQVKRIIFPRHGLIN